MNNPLCTLVLTDGRTFDVVPTGCSLVPTLDNPYAILAQENWPKVAEVLGAAQSILARSRTADCNHG